MSVTNISIPGGWGEREITVGGCQFKLVLPADPDEFLNQLDSSENAPWPDLYWAQLWPAAVTTAEFISHAAWPGNTKVLELGCGIGFVGLVALARGWTVTFSDYVPLALDLALENAQRNGFGRESARRLLLDWRHPPAERFPIIVASDVLYYRDCHEALIGTLTTMLDSEGECWLGDPGRSAAEEFVARCAQADWGIALEDQHGTPIRHMQLGNFRLIKLRPPRATP